MANSNGTKPARPHPDYPLFPHANGQWAKKIRGKLHYFGAWGDAEAALNLWLEQKDDLLAGRKPRVSGTGVVIRDIVNSFLTARQRKVDAGEMKRRSWAEYHATCEKIIAVLGRSRRVDDLRTEDFGHLRAVFAKGRAPESISGDVQRTRSVFKFAYEADLIDRPMKFGPEFKAPSRTAKRKARQARPPRKFSAEEIRRLVAAASTQMKAMILLGINCGLGNADCAELPKTAVDLKAAIIDYPRPKTAIDRRAALWPETMKALNDVTDARPAPKVPEDDRLVFITKYGHPWVRYQDSASSPHGTRIDSVVLEFGKLLRDLKLARAGVGFYALRHTFETIAGETGDQAAVDRAMGHVRDDMASRYREWVKDEREDARLRKISDHVRGWLFGPKATRKTRPAKARPKGEGDQNRRGLRLVRSDVA